MLDHIVGRPNPSWKRAQVFLVLIFWIYRIVYGQKKPPPFLWLRSLNRSLGRFSPWQLILSTLTAMYAMRNLDKLFGFGAPEPLARLYSPAYYRATWISNGLDAGFATAMTIRPKWLRDLCSILFSVYYIIYESEADEKLRKFRAVPTVEMLRTTLEKTTNPYIRFVTWLPKVSIARKILLRRPLSSIYKRPITAHLFFASSARQLSEATNLILDFPGGGFVAMTPEHHEQRLRLWAEKTGNPVLAIDYGKAPEYPYPFAIDEGFDTYLALVESRGKIIGMSGKKLNIIMSGDSAGASIVVSIMLKLLESQGLHLQHPSALVLNYAALDFNFTSWMSPANLRLLHAEASSGHISGLSQERNHYKHVSPLSMVGDRKPLRRQRSWKDTLRALTVQPMWDSTQSKRSAVRKGGISPPAQRHRSMISFNDETEQGIPEQNETDYASLREEDRPIQARVRFWDQSTHLSKGANARTSNGNGDQGTRLTMTSRTGYFQDRVISPTMMRAMAIMYIGPLRDPDFATDYYVSPILAPRELLAQFPPLLMQCGEKDPFVDDTIIFAGRVREAKKRRRAELDSALAKTGTDLGERPCDVVDDECMAALRRERDKLAKETEENWVEMVIFSDWSHGYLQMPSVMSEATAAISDMADWIQQVFASKQSSEELNMMVESSFIDEDSRSTSDSDLDPDEHITFGPKRKSSCETSPALTVEGRRLKTNNKARVTVQTITGNEVMRRRRLLDSHVFSGDMTR